MATFSSNCTGSFSGSSAGAATSQTKRLRRAMAIGSSTEPRVQAVSQGWAQTRPQTDGKGLGSLATR